ncbi:hypothetical protein [Microbacterium sp. BLY]|uniref:hypothetical protein n=1 Tax=Microbacterium sp. BLY TaxID=2823280 RepID=UPI001B33B2D9|nr:hypothetical protein [Microbacterium sp. BLY]MBP3978892.1 hypothetical protein [Microbacterium sp. BLY]
MSPPRIVRASFATLAVTGGLLLAGCAAAAAPGGTAPTSSSEEDTSFSAADLAKACIDATASAFPADVEFDSSSVRIEERTVAPEWLVLVPARTSGHDAEAQCTIGGTPEAVEIEMSTASLEPLPEEQIANLIRGENEGGTE